MSDAIQTMLRANRLVTVKSTGSHIAWEALDSTRSASCTRGRFGLQLIRRKINECSQTKGIVPYRLVHSSAHLPQSLQLPACYFISANSPPASGTCEEHKSTRAFPFVLCFFFFSEMQRRMNGSHYSHWVMNSFLTWQVTVMYRLSSYMWHIEMIGVMAGSDGFGSAARACVQKLNCKTGIHLKVGLKVKLKGCGAWVFQGYVYIKSFPKVLFFKF